MNVLDIKLGNRAKVLLALVVEKSVDDGWFLPRVHPSNWSKRTHEYIWVQGSGDARILKSLADKGLIKPHADPTYHEYWYQATEDGQLYYARLLETLDSSLQKKPAPVLKDDDTDN